MTQNNLAIALMDQAERAEGTVGAALLDETVQALRVALEVRTRAAHPMDWAETQNNLRIAVWTKAARVDGLAAAELLAEAVAAYQAALEVRTRAAHPAAWAGTQYADRSCGRAPRSGGGD